MFGTALIMATLAVAHFAWKYSGSNKWELVQDKKGVQFYELKVPGETRKQFKVVGRVKTTLNRIVATMTDTSPKACAQFVPGCVGGEILKQWDSQSLNYVQSFRINFKRVFSPREMVIKTQFSQDPQTKALLIECTAVPAPPNDCCVRVSDVNNTWRYTPLGNGQLQVEFVSNYDPGVPYFIYNRIIPRGLTGIPRHVERVFNKEQYGQTEFAWLNEG
ncbi:MAG TPA: hypothetical protein VE974_28365 [Thermoanaerobaculia bacterium]|nr:hypothetical protein [Thermoanaerobaculia bacterium]